MPSKRRLCRLCFSNEELVSVFDRRLEYGYQLRLCIYLCTGVEIRKSDRIAKMICHNCCSLSMQLYKFRQIALANDKTLKDLGRQPYEAIPSEKDELQQLQDSILLRISEASLSGTVKDYLDNEKTDDEMFRGFPPMSVPKETGSISLESQCNVDGTNEQKGENYESFSDSEDDVSIAALKRKYKATKRARATKDVVESRPYFFSESGSDSEPIYKANKRSKYYIDDDYQVSEITRIPKHNKIKRKKLKEVEKEQKEQLEDIRKERLRPQRPKPLPEPSPPPAPEPEPIEEDISEEAAADQKLTEPYSKYCEDCDRYFWGNSQLKAHQKVHYRCQFCPKGFESPELLQEHLVQVCYKIITARKAVVSVKRVDQDVQLLQTYKMTFDEYFEDISNGVYGDPQAIKNPSLKFHLYHTASHRATEKPEIEKIFQKFQNVDNTPIQKNIAIQTKRLQTDVAYTNSNQIILDDARKDLKLYDIPIHLVIDKIQSAYISFVKAPSADRTMTTWPVDNIQDVSDKSKIGSFYPEEVNLEQRKVLNNKNVMAPRIPMNIGPRRPMNNMVKKFGFEPRIRQMAPRGPMNNIRMNNPGKIIGIPRPGQNMIRKPFKTPAPPMKPAGKVLYRSPNPNINIGLMKSMQNHIDPFNQFKNTNVNIPTATIPSSQSNTHNFGDSKVGLVGLLNINVGNNTNIQNNIDSCNQNKIVNINIPQIRTSQGNVGSFSDPKVAFSNLKTMQSNIESTAKTQNTPPYPKSVQTIAGQVSLQRTLSPKTTNNNSPNNNTNDSNLNNKVGGLIKNASGSITIQLSKQNPKQSPVSNTPLNIVNISNSVTLEKNQQKPSTPVQSNLNVSYPPRPNTAIRNMLENISSEISIEPNYQRQMQNSTQNLNTVNSPNNAININNPSTMNTSTFAAPSSVAVPFKPNRINYPKPIMIKEEFPPEDNSYLNQEPIPEQLYDMEYSNKEDHQSAETQPYIKPEITDDPAYVYQNPQQINFNAGYPQETPLRYNQNPQQHYYRPVGRATNLPTVRHRFALTQPYQNMEYRQNNQLNMYQPRMNQQVSNIPASTISSNALVPTNSYNANNFMPSNVYNRSYGDNYNNYNMYQPAPYQNQYPPSYTNAQGQPPVEYNNTYSDTPPQENDSKFLRLKQPWELYR